MNTRSGHPAVICSDPDALASACSKAESWAGEPFLHEHEEPAVVFAAGTVRQRALSAALAEIDSGRSEPSYEWRRDYGLVLGLERVLAADEPTLASGTTLRRHQVDALAGLLGELIALAEKGDRSADEEDSGEDEELPGADDEEESEELSDIEPPEPAEVEPTADPGSIRRFRFRHPTAAGKTIAAAGFVEAGRQNGILILTHRRLLVDQFNRELSDHGYAGRFSAPVMTGRPATVEAPLTVETYAWFAKHAGEIDRQAYQLVICDEAHTALGEKTSAAIRSLDSPLYVGMTATDALLAKHVSDVFPVSVDDLPLQEASRRGLIAPLRCLRVPPVAAINSVPIVGGDFDQEILAKTLDHEAFNAAAASLYRDRFGSTPGVVYAAGVDHAENLARAFRAAGLKAEVVSGRTSALRLAETLAAYERGEIDILINAQLLTEGWNSPRATVCMHLAPTASRRVYQQRVGRIMRLHPRKEAGIVVDFVPKAATAAERSLSLHALIDADFYREGARVLPAPRRRGRSRRILPAASWLVPVCSDQRRRLEVISREWQRVDPSLLGEDEQRFWAGMAGRQVGFERRAEIVARLSSASIGATALQRFLTVCASENPHRKLRLLALADRARLPFEQSEFDDMVSVIGRSPTWAADRSLGVRYLLEAIAAGSPEGAEQVLERWAWQLAAAVRRELDRRVAAQASEAKSLLGALANTRGGRHDAVAGQIASKVDELPRPVAAAMLAAAEGYTYGSRRTLDGARSKLGSAGETAAALAEMLPQAKSMKAKRRRRRKKKPTATASS